MPRRSGYPQSGQPTHAFPVFHNDQSQETTGERTITMPAMEWQGAFPFNEDADGKGDEGLAALGPAHARKKRRTGLLIGLCLLAFVLLLSAGGFFFAHWYFSDRVAPGVTFGSVNVRGKNYQELTETVKQAVADSKVVLKDSTGKRATVGLKDLGVKVDMGRTVDRILNAKNDSLFGRINPFERQHMGLVSEVNEQKLDESLNKAFVVNGGRAVASSIAFDPASKAFTAKEGSDGRAVVDKPVRIALKDIATHPGGQRVVTVGYRDAKMPISLETARKASDEANQRLSLTLNVKNGNAKSFDIPLDQRVAWTQTKVDMGAGTITIGYDKDAISSYINQNLSKELDQNMVSQEDIVDENGTVMVTSVRGVDGVKIKNADNVAGQVYSALQSDQPAQIKVDADVTAHDVKQVKSEYRIVVDKSVQKAFVYKAGSLINTFDICSGKPGRNDTDNGNFFIYLKYAIQDMRGNNDDGSRYLSPGVKWVSYFNGGQGFHTADWNNVGISTGDPTHWGSHGCINLREADSKWIYDNCTNKTLVQVIGSTPSGPVR